MNTQRTFEGPTKRYTLILKFGLYVLNELDLISGADDDLKVFAGTETGFRDAWFLGYQLAKENVRVNLKFGFTTHVPRNPPINKTPTVEILIPAFARAA